MLNGRARTVAGAVVSVAGLAAAASAGAQGARAELPSATEMGDCNPVARILSLVVRRGDGTPVPDAVLTVRDARNGAVLARRARGSADGVYLVLGGGDESPTVPASGMGLQIEVAYAGRVRRVRWALRPPGGRCGAVQVRGPRVVTVR